MDTIKSLKERIEILREELKYYREKYELLSQTKDRPDRRLMYTRLSQPHWASTFIANSMRLLAEDEEEEMFFSHNTLHPDMDGLADRCLTMLAKVPPDTTPDEYRDYRRLAIQIVMARYSRKVRHYFLALALGEETARELTGVTE